MTSVTYSPLNVQVEILDVFDGPEGKLASVRALDGKPFVGGDKWPVATEYATVPASDLAPEKQPGQPANLLTLALAAARPQWTNGESVWLVGNGKNGKGAYLKNVGGWVYLYCIGYGPGLPVFYLDPTTNAWVESKQLSKNYPAWAAKASQALDLQAGKPPLCPVCRSKGKIFTVIGKGIGRDSRYNKWRSDPCPKCGGVK